MIKHYNGKGSSDMCVIIYLHEVFIFIQYFQEGKKKNTIIFVCVKS